MRPGRWHTREDSGLRLDRDFRWWHDGEPIEHPNIIEAFNRGVRVDDDGRVTLHFGNDWCVIEVEGAPYRVVAVDEAPEGGLSVRLSDRTAEWLAPSTLALDDDGVLSARVKQGRARARFSRDAQFQLAERLAVVDGVVVLEAGALRLPTPLSPALFISPSTA
ncbi:MAG: DUF1285 domain-containing protein [Myxococcaceae bacterium]|jgi:hypothetical protein|nr:DUF1285 domain-containing protein [Myxococcaceae bacterium]MCA3014290.1 DUF1285 domain-containing protein [Myxococcaceae bacterium]